jgi:hypothetical protein
LRVIVGFYFAGQENTNSKATTIDRKPTTERSSQLMPDKKKTIETQQFERLDFRSRLRPEP